MWPFIYTRNRASLKFQLWGLHAKKEKKPRSNPEHVKRTVNMSERCRLRPNERLSVFLFLALFSGALGLLATLFSCATDYWLLGSMELCRPPHMEAADNNMLFHEGLFWRCYFPVTSPKYSLWDLWILKAPHVKVCQAAFLFPFPAKEPFWAESSLSPAEASERPSAIGLFGASSSSQVWPLWSLVGFVLSALPRSPTASSTRRAEAFCFLGVCACWPWCSCTCFGCTRWTRWRSLVEVGERAAAHPSGSASSTERPSCWLPWPPSLV
ncbi:uncharacterized protein LOC144056479 isoform X2 [Vanacampus margaritifer]